MNKSAFARLNGIFAKHLGSLRAYFHAYDPAQLSLIYTLKSALALLLIIELSAILLPINSMIFAIFSSVFTFYMYSLSVRGWRKFTYLAAFCLIGALFALLMPWLIFLGGFLVVFFFIWIFFATITAGISDDLHKIAIYCTLLLMAMLISATLGKFDSPNAALAVLLGGTVAIIFRCYAPYSYGNYTRKRLNIILQDLSYVARELASDEYDEWLQIASCRIKDFKTALSGKSAMIKDASTVRNQEMAMFYAYKCEEILYTLQSLRTFFIRKHSNSYILTIQAEIIANLLELQKIFKDQKAVLKTTCLEYISQQKSLPILQESLSVLYYKMRLFASGGSIKLSRTSKCHPKIALISLLDWRNKYFRYALKCALACSCALIIASTLKLDHGIWIAMGTFTLFKEKINTTKINNKDTLIGSLIGFSLGLLLIFFFAQSIFVYPLLFTTYLFSIYFRHFPQRLASVFIMMNLAVFFCAVGLDYERLIAFRLLDFIVAYFIVLIFSSLWVAKAEDELRPSVLSTCALLAKFLASLKTRCDYELQEQILSLINTTKSLLEQSRTRENASANSVLLHTLLELNNLAINMANYTDVHKIGAKERSDIDILITRFCMLEKASQNLPAYIYESIDEKLLSEDAKMRFYCTNIFSAQSRLLKYLG